MSEEKKPKIDLKSRLQKMGGGQAPPAGASSGSVVPSPGSIPAPSLTPMPPPAGPAGIPVPFQSRPAPAIDPNNPLAAAAGAARPNAPPRVSASPPPPQRIEVDEAAIDEARRGVRKQGLVIAGLVGVLMLGVGFGAGTATESGSARAQGKKSAQELAADVTKAKESLKQIAEKLEAGRNTLGKDKKYPEALSKDLSAINVDFDGSKLAGRRFSGISSETMRDLVDFITATQGVNDRKKFVQGLLTRLQKPITDELAAAGSAPPIQWAVVVDKDTPGQGAFLTALAEPLKLTKEKPELPAELTFINPIKGSGNMKLPRLTSEKIPEKGAVITIVPQTFDRACPSETKGQIAQLVRQMGSLQQEIKAEKGAAKTDDMVEEEKVDLLTRADRLVAGLQKSQ